MILLNVQMFKTNLTRKALDIMATICLMSYILLPQQTVTKSRTNTSTGGEETENQCNNIIIPYVSVVSETLHPCDCQTQQHTKTRIVLSER